MILNASPIIYASRLGILWLFKELYGQITISRTVYSELKNEGLKYIEELIEKGFRLSYRDYKRIMKEVEGLGL